MKAVYIAQASVWRDGHKYVFDRKFYDGMQLYCELWPGKIHCIAWEADGLTPSFGTVSKAADNLPFAMTLLHSKSPLSFDGIDNISIAIGSADDPRQFSLPILCKDIPYLLDMEHTPDIRRDIITHEVRNPLRRFMRKRRLPEVEKRRIEVIKAAAGMAGNGLATFHHYSPIAKSSLLYFDTRATRVMQISAKELERKNSETLEGKPLRLVFSGRLVRIKGIDLLLKVANLLTRRNVPFSLDVFGSGEMHDQLANAGRNSSAIRVRGSADFETELMPALKTCFDLFVCCHRQGDPSCTYLETFASGVPMAGFANASLQPLSVLSQAALTAPMNNISDLADLVTKLHLDRPRLVALSQAAVTFSKAHTFEDEFQARVDFWKQLSRYCPKIDFPTTN